MASFGQKKVKTVWRQGESGGLRPEGKHPCVHCVYVDSCWTLPPKYARESRGPRISGFSMSPVCKRKWKWRRRGTGSSVAFFLNTRAVICLFSSFFQLVHKRTHGLWRLSKRRDWPWVDIMICCQIRPRVQSVRVLVTNGYPSRAQFCVLELE